MARISQVGWCLALVFVWTGCGDEDNSVGNKNLGTLDFLLGMESRYDVDGVWVDVDRIACDREDFGRYQIELDLDLEEVSELRLQGDKKVDFDDEWIRYGVVSSIHLPAGCYQVNAQPRTSDHRQSASCERLYRDDVEIVKRRTTRVELKGICRGDGHHDQDDGHPRDRCDFSYNDSPYVSDLDIQRYQTYPDCDSVSVCVTAYDPDNHEIEFTWEQTGGYSLESPRIYDRSGTYGQVTECVEVRFDHPDQFDFRVTAYDVIDSCDHGRIRSEEWLEREGYHRDSHDSRSFAFHGRDYCDDYDGFCDYSDNHKPYLTDLTVERSPGPHDCDRARVCASAYDPEGQELEFVWEQTGGPWMDQPRVYHRSGRLGEVTECVEMDIDQYDDYYFRLTVYDLTGSCGFGRMRIEDWLRREGYHRESNDYWTFELRGEDYCQGYDPYTLGRTVVFVVAMSHYGIPYDLAAYLVERAVAWVSPVYNPRVLLVLDDNHLNCYQDEASYLRLLLEHAGYYSDYTYEPSWGLRSSDLNYYDVIWFTNPSYRLDDLETYHALEAFLSRGGGLILSGDDITRPVAGEYSMSRLTHLEHVSNGKFTCLRRTDDNRGHDYLVEITNGHHPVTSGLGGAYFLYGDDIDHSRPLHEGEEVLAWARLNCSCWCQLTTPVIVAYDPLRHGHPY